MEKELYKKNGEVGKESGGKRGTAEEHTKEIHLGMTNKALKRLFTNKLLKYFHEGDKITKIIETLFALCDCQKPTVSIVAIKTVLDLLVEKDALEISGNTNIDAIKETITGILKTSKDKKD
jgi:hypothetical protein